MKTTRAGDAAIGDEALRVIVSRDQIAERVDRLACRISEFYQGQELTMLAVLTGSVVFLADLIRRLTIPVRLEVAQVSSYPNESTSPQALRFTLPLTAPLAGRHVLVVDDILDSGRTMAALLKHIESMKPASVRTCVLLRKARPDLHERIDPDLVGFDLPNEFVVGYGLDFDNLYRNLPDLCVLKSVPGAKAESDEEAS
ncbi:MAG: hypoxanthine phosphoribosyltransferase [Planctomycetota bacterium]|jgi:hypoxanthine phosphoribosyltransferase